MKKWLSIAFVILTGSFLLGQQQPVHSADSSAAGGSESSNKAKTPDRAAAYYHFALAPRMIKEARPDARVAIFWHIPWPNPEAFGICPWQKELLDGLLGADLIGFHIQSHCNNFLDSVDRVLESRIDRENFAVNRRGHLTRQLLPVEQ